MNMPATTPPKSSPSAIGLLKRCETFISGFEDDDTQEGVRELLADLRKTLGYSCLSTIPPELSRPDMPDQSLSIWTVYDHPTDFPTEFVARRHKVRPGSEPVATTDLVRGDSLAAVRTQIPRGLTRLPRNTQDDPCIVEVWL